MLHKGIPLNASEAQQPRTLGTAEHVLIATEQRLREILDAAPVAFISADVEGIILDWNAQAELIFGWSRSEALGRKLTETLLPPAVRSAYEHELSDLLASHDAKPDARRIELSMLRKSGQEFRVEVTLSRLSAGNGYLFRVFARDISPQRQAEEERRYTEELLAHQALHDRLTGLPNRALLIDRLGHALALADRRECVAALLFADLDAFSLVNSSLGPQLGDELLVQVSRRLQDVLRISDTVSRADRDTLARVGGDEFVVLCEALSSERDAIAIVERITAALKEPFAVGDDRVFVKLSIGIALGSSGATPTTLLRDAGIAMNRAKERGGDRYEVFDPATRVRVLDRMQRENALREALEGEQLRAYYQPIVSAVDGGIVGVETLLRWEHPEHGLRSPDEFIPLAEESGLIVPIGHWVLDQAWAQLTEWRDTLGVQAPLHVSVNVSARQLVEDGIVDHVKQLVEQSSLGASQLVLEITESSLIEDTDERAAVIGQLKALGIRLALDDFGTGYSSLSYLRSLPFDVLKLDRAFVSGLGQTAADPQIVAAVIEMARALAMTVIAEGVETQEQLDHLRRAGCNYLQGYLFAAPMPAHELPAFLLTH